MRKTNVMGIVFPNAHDHLMGEMTEFRSMGSLPFCGRYRIIDFSLSNLVNAGVSKVGIVTKNNYQSLMDHIGSAKAWDLDRKSGGLYFLPPYSNTDAKVYKGHVDGLFGAMTFLMNSSEEYVIMCDCDIITNFDLSNMIKRHIKSGADITIAYKKGVMPKNRQDVMAFELDGDKVTDILFSAANTVDSCVSLDITIMSRELLISIIKEGYERNFTSIARDVYQRGLSKLDIRGYEVAEYAAIMDSPETYAKVSAEIVGNPDIRRQLFCKDRPVFTKTRDDMPTIYGLDSEVKNSLIADGCVIE
ncbi:MAG: glucose-1-phosphate adenylyltransferase subunit GlgD, partial [Clostridia bacterium]|nr:glucose-1-phosphate adenylyltransferase subunit GlgD [Clostridia bacterium]